VNAYASAVKSLMDECITKKLGDNEVAGLLSILRGHDAEDNKASKVTVTAPLRLHLLGVEAYEATKYTPKVAQVAPLVKVEQNNTDADHFTSHIIWATNLITRHGIASGDERMGYSPLGGLEVGNYIEVVVSGTGTLEGRLGQRGKIVAVRNSGKGFVVEFPLARMNHLTNRETNGIAADHWGNADSRNLMKTA
jgi:hypothetical protein